MKMLQVKETLTGYGKRNQEENLSRTAGMGKAVDEKATDTRNGKATLPKTPLQVSDYVEKYNSPVPRNEWIYYPGRRLARG